MKTNPISQHGAAVALVQLLEEHPTLPALSWRISNHKHLASTLSGSATHVEDPRPVVAAWAEALGVEVTEKPFLYEDDAEYVEFAVTRVWRDVPVQIYASCPVSLLVAENAQVAA
ncbi:hypothetical protein ACWDBT_30430 [Streptomyces ardesiacus]